MASPLLIPALALGAIAPSVMASIIRDDRTEASSIALGSGPAFAAARLSVAGGVGSGTLVAPDWVLTAAHVVTSDTGAPLPLGSVSVLINGQQRSVTGVSVRPGWTGANYTAGLDLALVHLSSPVASIAPALMDFGPAPVGGHATIVGYGAFGFGSSGFMSPPGALHGATNILDALASTIYPTWSASLMLMDFDSPTSTSWNRTGTTEVSDIEGVPASGDSGGGTFVQVGGVWTLVGVHSFTFTAGPVAASGGYGTGAADVLLVDSAAWIQSVIPAPGGGMLGIACALLGMRRRRR